MLKLLFKTWWLAIFNTAPSVPLTLKQRLHAAWASTWNAHYVLEAYHQRRVAQQAEQILALFETLGEGGVHFDLATETKPDTTTLN